MKMSISADVDLDAGGHGSGYVTWFEVRAHGADGSIVGAARAALVHVGEIADARADLDEVLREARLSALGVYFADGWYRDEYAEGAGIDLLFVERVVVESSARNLDFAIVRRLTETIASGCQLTCMPYADAFEAARWASIGFETSTHGRSSGLLHLRLGMHHARLVHAEGCAFDVLGAPPPLRLRRVGN